MLMVVLSPNTMSKLTDSEYQRGIEWRMHKMEAIHEAWEQGMTDPEIHRILVRAGVTPAKARELIQTAKQSMTDARSKRGRMPHERRVEERPD